MLVSRLEGRFEGFPAFLSLHAFLRGQRSGGFQEISYFIKIDIPDRPADASMASEGMTVSVRCTGGFQALMEFWGALDRLYRDLDGEAELADCEGDPMLRFWVGNRSQGIILIEGKARLGYWSGESELGSLEFHFGGLHTDQSYLAGFLKDLKTFVKSPLEHFRGKEDEVKSDLTFPFDGWLRVLPHTPEAVNR